MDSPFVVLTGGSSGIGYALLTQLLESGYTVLNVSRHRPVISRALDRSFIHLTSDLSSISFHEQLDAGLGSMCKSQCVGLIHCAGLGQISTIDEMSYEEIANIIQVNLTSSILLVKALLPYLNKIESKIYLLGSRGRRFAFAGGVAYCASKAGLSLVADALSLEFRACGWNIGVSLFEFGTVATGFAAVPTNSKQITTNGAAALIFECFQRPLDDFDLRRIEVVPSVARLNHE